MATCLQGLGRSPPLSDLLEQDKGLLARRRRRVRAELHHRSIVLREDVAGVGGHVKVVECALPVLLHAPAAQVHHAQVELGLW